VVRSARAATSPINALFMVTSQLGYQDLNSVSVFFASRPDTALAIPDAWGWRWTGKAAI